MKLKIIVMTGLFTFNAFALDELLPQGKELNKLIEMYGLDVDLPDQKVYPTYLGQVNKNNVPANHQINDEEDVVGDMVKTIQAAEIAADELIFYEYGKKAPPAKKKDPKSDLTALIDNKNISSNVDLAIKRVQKVPPVMPPGQMMDYLKALESMGKGPKDIEANTRIRIYAYEGEMGKKIGDVVYNFEFLPSFDERDVFPETGDGYIDIEKHLNSPQGILRGGVVKRNYVRTKIDLPLRQGKSRFLLPLLRVDALEDFLQKENLKGLGGFILLNLDESVVSVDIDANYEAKIYLDDKLKVVDEGAESFVFYVGVPMGNVLLKVLDKKKEIAQKIIHVTENEVFFDYIDLLSGGVERIDLFEKKLLGKVETELNIPGSSFSVFNTDFTARNIGINTYEFYHPATIKGARKYYSLGFGGNEIYLGNLFKKKIEVPNSGFMDSVLDFFNIESLYKQCIVQINMSMPVIDFKAMGESEYDTLNIEIYFLGSDGKFSEEINDLTEKAFIYGNFQGLVNGEISYEDGSKDYFQSYCSDSTYLVEQY